MEYECERLFGFPCDAVTDDIPVREDWQSMVDLRDAPAIHPWREFDRPDPLLRRRDGGLRWGDPTESVADIGQETGGDCADDSYLANRGMSEGPGDLLGQLEQGGPRTTTRSTVSTTTAMASLTAKIPLVRRASWARGPAAAPTRRAQAAAVR